MGQGQAAAVYQGGNCIDSVVRFSEELFGCDGLIYHPRPFIQRGSCQVRFCI